MKLKEGIYMKKQLLSAILAVVVMCSGVAGVSVAEAAVTRTSTGEIEVNLSTQEITNERLAEMVVSGEIPQNVTFLNLSRNSITDFSPLGELPNLTTLRITFSSISDLTTLSGLTNLRTLTLHGNSIVDLTGLESLVNLQRLNLQNNHIRDVTLLSSLTNLETLWLAGNPITAGQVNELQQVLPSTDIRHNAREELIDDEKLTQMLANGEVRHRFGSLVLSNNQITDISLLADFLAKNTDITTLDLRGNLISDITPLKSLTHLQVLNISGNQITDISPLAGLTRLWWLEMNSNQISDATPLASLTAIDTRELNIFLRGNPVHNNAEHFAEIDRIRESATERTTLTLGHLLGFREYTVHDAIEILRFVAGLPSVLDDCPIAPIVALIVNCPQTGPGVADAIAILRHLNGLPSALNSR
jgi:Leucine-rich repeat (LRR) protein